jgi:hypothetical protein
MIKFTAFTAMNDVQNLTSPIQYKDVDTCPRLQQTVFLKVQETPRLVSSLTSVMAKSEAFYLQLLVGGCRRSWISLLCSHLCMRRKIHNVIALLQVWIYFHQSSPISFAVRMFFFCSSSISSAVRMCLFCSSLISIARSFSITEIVNCKDGRLWHSSRVLQQYITGMRLCLDRHSGYSTDVAFWRPHRLYYFSYCRGPSHEHC